MHDEPPAGANVTDAGFAAWLNGLGFSIEPKQLSAARQAFDRLTAMKQMNRAPPSHAAPRARGGHE
ncbi:MAG TPA: hypothetical protein VH678_31945 [Xanthobacteraceae bacterium]|jgi:hypothetical protein